MKTIDQVMPNYEFSQHHSRWIDAPPQVVWDVLVSLTLSELTLTRPLLWLRHLGHPPLAQGKPLFQYGPVTLFEVDAPHYALAGAVSQPWKLTAPRLIATDVETFNQITAPGWVKYLTDFQCSSEKGGTRLATETRGYATSKVARRRFKLYWTIIRVGSSVVRYDILDSVARKVHVMAMLANLDVKDDHSVQK